MGQSCSSQLKEAQVKNKQLEGRIRLYEQSITDKSIHASQTNFDHCNSVGDYLTTIHRLLLVHALPHQKTSDKGEKEGADYVRDGD